MRTLTAGGRTMLCASRTSDGPLVCITLSHPNLSAPIYVVNDIQPVTRDGHDFVALPFRWQDPDEREDSMPTATIEIDNVDRSIGEAVLALPSRPSIKVEIIRILDKLSIERGPWSMTLVSCTITRLVVSGQLGLPEIWNEPYPGDTYTPGRTPQLFNA